MNASSFQKVDYRARARGHHETALRLLASGSAEDLRFACLSLRSTIEALAYDMVQLYRNDLPPETVKTWQPNKVLAELADLDPGCQGTMKIEVGPVASDEGPTITFVDRRLTSDWVNEHYHKLGNFIHENTIYDVEQGRDGSQPKIRDRAERIAKDLGEIIESNGWNFRMTFDCDKPCVCGGAFVFKFSPHQRSCRARCSGCDAYCEATRPEADAKAGAPDNRIRFSVSVLETGRPWSRLPSAQTRGFKASVVPHDTDVTPVVDALKAASLLEDEAPRARPPGLALLARDDGDRTVLLVTPEAARHAHTLPGTWVDTDPGSHSWKLIHLDRATPEEIGRVMTPAQDGEVVDV